MRLDGQRRLQDGDIVRCGQTQHRVLPHAQRQRRDDARAGRAVGDAALLQQQQQILRELCRPLLGDGEGVSPLADDEIAERLGTDQKTVTTELEHLARQFGLSEMPFFERRAEIAMLALRSGLVKADE